MTSASTWRDRAGLPSTAGRRKLVTAAALDSLGTGAFLPFAVLYFTQTTPVSLASVGVCLSLAAVLAAPAAPLFGGVVDRFGPRQVILASNALRCLLFAVYPLADRPWHIVVLVCATSAADNVFWTANGALVALVADAGERPRWYAMERMLRNAGLGLGTLLGTAAAGFGVGGYHLIVWGNALSFAIAGALVSTWKPAVEPSGAAQAAEAAEAAGHGGYRRVLHDKPFLTLVASHLLMILSCLALPVLLPIFIVESLHAPSWWCGTLVALNTVVVVVGQGVFIRLTEHLTRPRIVQIAAGLWILSYLILMACTGHTWLTAVCLTIGVLVYTAAEILWTPTASSMSAGTAPDDLRGRYMAVNQLSWATGNIVAPALFTGLLAHGASLPWLVLTACCIGAAALMRPLSRILPASAIREADAPKKQPVPPGAEVPEAAR